MGAHGSKPRNKHHAPKPNGAASSPFFQLLPAELRRRILIDAFGGRTLHPQPPSCVCRSIHLKYRTANPAADDWCIAIFGEDSANLKDTTWMVGVMGWLLCCRQAYVEGIEVLYATNTFHVWSGDLDRNPLVEHFPAPYLSLVRSVEWVVDGYPWVWTAAEFERPKLDVVRTLPITMLPNLEKLYIGFRDMKHVWPCFLVPEGFRLTTLARRYQLYTERIVAPLDMLISAGIVDGLRELEVGIPMSAFHPHLQRAIRRGAKVERLGEEENIERGAWGAWGPRQRIWRSFELGREEHSTRGYWLSESFSDVPKGFPDSVSVYWA